MRQDPSHKEGIRQEGHGGQEFPALVYFWSLVKLQVQEAGVLSHPAFLYLGNFVFSNMFLQKPRMLGAIGWKHHQAIVHRDKIGARSATRIMVMGKLGNYELIQEAERTPLDVISVETWTWLTVSVKGFLSRERPVLMFHTVYVVHVINLFNVC